MSRDRLLDALERALAGWGMQVDRLSCQRRPWSSVTFSGERLQLAYALAAPPPSDLVARLDAHDFGVRGQIVADITVEITTDRLFLELLTIDEASGKS